MVKRNWIVALLFFVLLGGAIVEQVYIDTTYSYMEEQVENLQNSISSESEETQTKVLAIQNYWKDREVVLSLFVDYRDIEQIGKQIDLVKSHLTNFDYDLAIVECNLLSHIVSTYHNTISFDWQNII